MASLEHIIVLMMENHSFDRMLGANMDSDYLPKTPQRPFDSASALTEAGHKLVECGDGRAALDRIASTSFHLVVTDVRLPRTDGLAVKGRRALYDPRPDGVSRAARPLTRGSPG